MGGRRRATRAGGVGCRARLQRGGLDGPAGSGDGSAGGEGRGDVRERGWPRRRGAGRRIPAVRGGGDRRVGSRLRAPAGGAAGGRAHPPNHPRRAAPRRYGVGGTGARRAEVRLARRGVGDGAIASPGPWGGRCRGGPVAADPPPVRPVFGAGPGAPAEVGRGAGWAGAGSHRGPGRRARPTRSDGVVFRGGRDCPEVARGAGGRGVGPMSRRSWGWCWTRWPRADPGQRASLWGNWGGDGKAWLGNVWPWSAPRRAWRRGCW